MRPAEGNIIIDAFQQLLAAIHTAGNRNREPHSRSPEPTHFFCSASNGLNFIKILSRCIHTQHINIFMRA